MFGGSSAIQWRLLLLNLFGATSLSALLSGFPFHYLTPCGGKIVKEHLPGSRSKAAGV
jgi:hypothetical protein